ncbi:membrane hypothetical protein [Gammaproteobacteria bacterium]
MCGRYREEMPVVVRQVVRWVAIAIWCGWFSAGTAFAATETRTAEALSDTEIASFGCLTGGTGLFAAGYVAGPSEAIMLWGGGLLVPSGSTVLAISLLGALGAAGCSIGATLAPTVVWFSDQSGRFLSYLVSRAR